MSTIKNDQISPCCHFNKIIKDSGTSFQFKRKRNFHYVSMPMMRSQILKFVDFKHKNLQSLAKNIGKIAQVKQNINGIHNEKLHYNSLQQLPTLRLNDLGP